MSIVCVASMLCLVTGCGNEGMLNNPKDVKVENVIKNLSGVKSTCLVTEENDPNGQMNKSGGYTGVVYFRLTQVDERLEAMLKREMII